MIAFGSLKFQQTVHAMQTNLGRPIQKELPTVIDQEEIGLAKNQKAITRLKGFESSREAR